MYFLVKWLYVSVLCVKDSLVIRFLIIILHDLDLSVWSMVSSHGAIATAVLLFQQIGINEKCSHGMI